MDVGTAECGNATKWVVIPGQDPSIRLPEKESVRDVRFSKPYGGIPKVFLSVTYLDSEHTYNLRYKVILKSVSKEGFRFTCTTWWDTEIYNMFVSWISISGTDAN